MKYFPLLEFYLFGELMVLDALTGCALLGFYRFGKLYMVLLDALTGCVFLLEFHLCVELVLLDLTGHMYLFLLEFHLLFELMLWGQLIAGLFGDLHVVMLKKDARLGGMVKSDVLKA